MGVRQVYVRWVRALGSALLTLVLLLVGPMAAACSCAVVTMAESIRRADVVARAVVVRIDAPRFPLSSADLATYTLRATTVWKGEATPTVVVRSAVEGASCGIGPYVPGDEIVVFAQRDGDHLRSSVCGGTARVTDDLVAKVVAAAGPGTPVSAAGSELQETGWLLPVGVVTLVGLLTLGIWLWWRRSGSRR